VEDIILKYQLLPPENQQELQDFLDFLLTRKKRKPFNMKVWKRKILSISAWSEVDIKKMKNRRFTSWDPQAW